MKITDLKVGSIVGYSNGKDWRESKIIKVSKKFVWFKGSGYDRIAKQTFKNHPQLYKIIKI